MYARLQKIIKLPFTRGQEPAQHMLDTLKAQPGFAGAAILRSLTTPGGAICSLWETKQYAEQSTGGRHPEPDAHDQVYAVREVYERASAGQQPTIAQLVWFDGPRSEAQAAADDLAAHRISPVATQVEGGVETWALRGEGLSKVILALCTDVDVLGRTADAIAATDLLPGEDPALVPVPDRAELYRVTAFEGAHVAIGA